MAKSRFVVVAFASLMLASLHAQAVPLSDGETAEPGASDYEITGRVFFGAGEYSGKISGEGTAVIETGGNTAVCVFSNGENSYSGGTIISNAAWRVTENGATGTGKITIGLQASYFLVAGNATVIANEIEVMQSSNTSYQKGSIQMPLWHEVEFTGGIRAHGVLAVMPTRKANTYEGGMTVYNCDVRCFEGASKMDFYPYGYGTNIFRKAWHCPSRGKRFGGRLVRVPFRKQRHRPTSCPLRQDRNLRGQCHHEWRSLLPLCRGCCREVGGQPERARPDL